MVGQRCTKGQPNPPTAGRFADSLWDRFVAQLNIQQPTRNIQYSRKDNAALRFTRVETAKKKMSGSTSRGGQWIFLVGYWKFLVGCWILKKWFLSNDGSGSWKKPAKRLAPCGDGWPMMHQGPIQPPDGWPFCRLPLAPFRRQLNIQQPTRNFQSSRKENAALRLHVSKQPRRI